MAQKGVIVQITHLFHFKIYKKNCNQVFLKCNISVKARDRKMDISIEWALYILGYKHVSMLQLSFEALVFFSFSISPILLTCDWRWVLFPLLLQFANFCKIASVFVK